MSYDKKYLKYKEKYLNLKKTLEKTGINVVKDYTSENFYTLDTLNYNNKILSDHKNNSEFSELILSDTLETTVNEKNVVKSNVKNLETNDIQTGGNIINSEELSELILSNTVQTENKKNNISDQISELMLSDTVENNNVSQKGGSLIDEYSDTNRYSQDPIDTIQKGGLDNDLSEMILSDSVQLSVENKSVFMSDQAPVQYTDVNNTANCSKELEGGNYTISSPSSVDFSNNSATCPEVNPQPNVEIPVTPLSLTNSKNIFTTTNIESENVKSDIDVLLNQLGGKKKSKKDPYYVSDSMSSLFESSSSPEDFSDFDTSLSLSDL